MLRVVNFRFFLLLIGLLILGNVWLAEENIVRSGSMIGDAAWREENIQFSVQSE